MNYARPWTKVSGQLELLKSRGMKVGDASAALSYLERIGYYRLSAYWYPFRIWTMQQNVQRSPYLWDSPLVSVSCRWLTLES